MESRIAEKIILIFPLVFQVYLLNFMTLLKNETPLD